MCQRSILYKSVKEDAQILFPRYEFPWRLQIQRMAQKRQPIFFKKKSKISFDLVGIKIISYRCLNYNKLLGKGIDVTDTYLRIIRYISFIKVSITNYVNIRSWNISHTCIDINVPEREAAAINKVTEKARIIVVESIKMLFTLIPFLKLCFCTKKKKVKMLRVFIPNYIVRSYEFFFLKNWNFRFKKVPFFTQTNI